MCVIKDNSISLLEFVFDLNFDEIIFPENPIKIIQNKDKDFLKFLYYQLDLDKHAKTSN